MKRLCDHCHLEFDEKVLIKTQIAGKEKYFCCKGCEGVYRLLQDQGLGDFYSKLGSNTLEPIQEEIDNNLAYFDSPAFFEHYVEKRGKACEISLVLEKIHCIACVWLHE